jgi:hypothetical protein
MHAEQSAPWVAGGSIHAVIAYLHRQPFCLVFDPDGCTGRTSMFEAVGQ